jgi:glucoamylase
VASSTLRTAPPDVQSTFPAGDIVNAGFLELVRYGIRKPDASLIVDSLRVVDAVLKVETPFGPFRYRYNNDGYRQREDGGPFVGSGKGRSWPLLVGERGHFELRAGHNANSFIREMEGFSSPTGVCLNRRGTSRVPTSICSRATHGFGPAAHVGTCRVHQTVEIHRGWPGVRHDSEVAARYLGIKHASSISRCVKHNRQVRRIGKGYTLRIQVPAPFRLHCTSDQWNTLTDTPFAATALGIDFRMFQFRQISAHRSDSHFFGRPTARGKAVIIW